MRRPTADDSRSHESVQHPSIRPNRLSFPEANRARPVQNHAFRPQPASPLREREDYFGLQDLVKSLPTTPEDEISVSPRSSLPFPSRPSTSRPDSRASRRLSRRSLGPTPPTSPSSFYFSHELADRRESGEGRRMAAFLDKTATAMEGGKSLAMVLPPRKDIDSSDADAEAGLTFLEALAFEEEHAPANPRSSIVSDVDLKASTSSCPARMDGNAVIGGESASPSGVVGPAPTSATRTSPSLGAARSAEKRSRVIQELVDTERSHAVDMAVVRDIYLARARGAHLTQIADHVMGTGLGLHRENPRKQRSTASPAPLYRLGQPLMLDADVETVFINLEEVAALAATFADALTDASGSGDQPNDDRIGSVFLDMLPRIQEVSSRYCIRHHRAILRLQELEPTLKTYLSECSTLSHGRTTAWDLASLLIKPVQRCLKYPLLLDQLLSTTPDDHPDRPALQRAYTEMLLVAEHINENKKRTDLVTRIVAKDKVAPRRDSSRSMSDSLSKKLRRTSQRTRNVFDTLPNRTGDEMFDALVALVHSTRTGAQRFCQEMQEWAGNTRSALEAQVRLVEGWIDMYAPLIGERPAAASHERLCVFLDEVLVPIISGPWASLDEEVRSSLSVKAQHLLSLFDNPLQVIAKRSDKALDHARYLAKKQPVDKRGSEEFLLLSAQLSEELPRFLGSVSRYFNIIVSHFASAQAAYHEAVRERWDAYADRWITAIPRGSPRTVQEAFNSEHQPFALMMRTLATGLGLSGDIATGVSAGSSPGSTARTPELEAPRSIPSSGPLRRESHLSTASERTADSDTPLSILSTPRTSITSTGSCSPRLDGAVLSITGKATPEQGSRTPLARQFPETFQSGSGPVSPKSTAPSASPVWREGPTFQSDHASSQGMADFASHLRPQRADGRRDAAALRSRYLSQYSVVLPSEAGSECSDDCIVPLYVAEAINASRSSSFRSGFPILSFDAGDRFEVEYEEADRAEGGSGWLLGRKPHDRGNVGWARTEDFVLLDDVLEGEEEEELEEGEEIPFA
ncbi:hypothetical protein JCM10908_001574 [Rhodotorula pacifica]|uniref:uncharacterized protein n=1 Tax=Rhodotorula pacifica TaxID=1495444 RepID=UPI00317790C8